MFKQLMLLHLNYEPWGIEARHSRWSGHLTLVVTTPLSSIPVRQITFYLGKAMQDKTPNNPSHDYPVSHAQQELESVYIQTH
jgi:hypothetical protein